MSHFSNEMSSLSFNEVSREETAVMVRKLGITVLANAEIVFINCAADVYQGFEAMKAELQTILVVLDKLGVTEIKNATCVKENVYKLEKAKVKSTLNESQFAGILFKKSFVANPVFTDSREDIRVMVTRNFSDSLTEAKMQLLVSAFLTSELPLSVLAEKLQEIDRASFDAWSAVISDGVKKIMEA